MADTKNKYLKLINKKFKIWLVRFTYEVFGGEEEEKK